MKTSIAVINLLGSALAEAVSDLALKQGSIALSPAKAAGAALKGDLVLLEKGWSSMAVRNLLRDVLRSVKAIASSLGVLSLAIKGGTVKAVATPESLASALDICKDLERRIDKEMGQHSPNKLGYAKVVCVGYKVKVTAATYQGATDDAADMQLKCQEMITAIQAAHALADRDGRNHNGNSNILKVFMAPEFFFRGRNGAYDHGVVHGNEARTDEANKPVSARSAGIVETLRQEIDKPAYKDWLFVLGTAIAASKETAWVCKSALCKGKVVFDIDKLTHKSKGRCSLDASHAVAEVTQGAYVENVAFVIKEGQVHTVSKELVSHVDFKGHHSGKDDRVTLAVEGHKQRLQVQRHDTASQYKSATKVATSFSDERMGGCIFTIDGITFGLEVCLDHAATTSSDTSGRLSHAANIQIQLIPSAGMTIGSLRALPGGVVFNVDGSTPHVQLIGGVNPEVHLSYDHDYKFANATWSSLKDIGADIKKLTTLKDSGGGSWVTATPPPGGPAGRGGVLLYGPFDIPAN